MEKTKIIFAPHFNSRPDFVIDNLNLLKSKRLARHDKKIIKQKLAIYLIDNYTRMSLRTSVILFQQQI